MRRNSTIQPPRPNDDKKFWLRLVVVRLEGLIGPRPESFLDGSENQTFSDRMFPAWCEQLNRDQESVRELLAEEADSIERPPVPEVVDLMELVHDHTPVRVGVLSPGPDEWAHNLLNALEISTFVDYQFTFDNYHHADRDIQLQFLMNRFIAGRERTLLIGSDPVDQEVANRQEARFCSPLPAPGGSTDESSWNWSLEKIRQFVESNMPEE